MSQYGMNSGFAAYLLLSIPCVLCALKMEFSLGTNKQQQQEQQLEEKPEQKGAVDNITPERDVSNHGLAAENLSEHSSQQHCEVNGQPQHTAEGTAQPASWQPDDVEQHHLLDQQQLSSQARKNAIAGCSRIIEQDGVCIVVHDESVFAKGTDLKLEQQVLSNQHNQENVSNSGKPIKQQQQQQQQESVFESLMDSVIML